eukprot:775333-Pleurochrysis_carterae.AAC.2
MEAKRRAFMLLNVLQALPSEYRTRRDLQAHSSLCMAKKLSRTFEQVLHFVVSDTNREVFPVQNVWLKRLCDVWVHAIVLDEDRDTAQDDRLRSTSTPSGSGRCQAVTCSQHLLDNIYSGWWQRRQKIGGVDSEALGVAVQTEHVIAMTKRVAGDGVDHTAPKRAVALLLELMPRPCLPKEPIAQRSVEKELGGTSGPRL